RAHGTDLVRGVEFVRRYFDTLGLVRLVRRELAGVLPRTDFGMPAMVLAILALLIAGGRRLRHLRYVDGDPLVLRLCGLRRLPTPRTVGRWLRVFRAEHLLPLQWLNALLVARAIRHAGVRRIARARAPALADPADGRALAARVSGGASAAAAVAQCAAGGAGDPARRRAPDRP